MKLVAALLLGLALSGPAASASAQTEATTERLRARVEFGAETGQLTVAGAEIVGSSSLALLYGPRGYQPLWRDPAMAAQLLALVQESYDDGFMPVDYHLTALARLWPVASTHPTPENLADFDILASDAYMLLLEHLYFGKVDPQSLEPVWNFQDREIEGRPAVDFVRDAIAAGDLRATVTALRPSHWMYTRGREILARYRRILADGGWPEVPPGVTLKPGVSDPRVTALRQRLSVTGDLADQSAGASLYDEPLAAAVRNFQERHRLKPDAEVGPATLAELNVPVEARIHQIQVNLERARHVLGEIGNEDLVIVDIAGYELRYVQNHKVIWTSRVQVGRPFRQTPVFKSAIDHVILNPTWTVPPTILGQDVLPAVRRDPGYLARRGLEVLDRNGRSVDPASIDWNRYTEKNFPYFLRQAAGDDNALGRVKIMFPNPYLVYLHETPARSLFEKEDRAFSSGCIRVERPFELVERLLAGSAWDASALQRAVATKQTRTIWLQRPVKLLLIYWTVDEDDLGRVVFRRDIYGRDPLLWRALNERFEFGPRPGQ